MIDRKEKGSQEDIRPILFFDSGIGGLTVLHETRLKIPDRPFIYVADNAAFPYGSWEEETLRQHILALMGDLLERHDPYLSIIACNTASTLVLSDLRHLYKKHLFVGTVPAIKPAAELTFTGLVSVLATPGTVKRAYTKRLIDSYAQKCSVQLVGSEKLAQYAEEYLRGMKIDPLLIKKEIEPCFVSNASGRTDIVVLACTHYPFLVNLFRKIAPWPVDWLNPAEAIAQQAASFLPPIERNAPIYVEKHRIIEENKDKAYFTANRLDHFTQKIVQGFGLQLCSFT